MKRYLIAGGVGSMVFAAALGSAAALGINDAGVAQYGESTDLSCDSNGVNIAGYTSEPGMDQGPAKSYDVTVTGVSPACLGKTLVAAVTDGSGNTIGHGYSQINGSTVRVEWESKWGDNGKINAGDIEGVRLLIG